MTAVDPVGSATFLGKKPPNARPCQLSAIITRISTITYVPSSIADSGIPKAENDVPIASMTRGV